MEDEEEKSSKGIRGLEDGEARWTENALSTAAAQRSSRSRSLSHWKGG